MVDNDNSCVVYIGSNLFLVNPFNLKKSFSYFIVREALGLLHHTYVG